MNNLDLTTAPPAAIEGEQVILGSLMQVPSLISDVAQIVSGADFYDPKHQRIFETLQQLSDDGKPVETASLIITLRDSGELAQCGGADYLARLSRQSRPASTMYFAEVVSEKAAKRRLMQMHNIGLRNAQDGSGLSLDALIAESQSVLDEIAEERVTSDVVRVNQSLAGTFDLMEKLGQSAGGVTGVPTGFLDLDDMTSGLHPGQMIVIAARPAVGKSTLGMDIVRSASVKHGLTSLFFSLEMSRDEINMRLLSAEARVQLQHVRSGKLDDAEWARIGKYHQPVSDAPLFVDDTANITMEEIRTKARRLKQQHGLDLIVIDYLQLMSSGKKVESRQQEVSEFSRGIKLLAKELGVPIIAMSQLNRGSEQRSDNKPKVSDLRESGSIEQDADVIILLYREEVHDPNSARVGEADLIVAKQRNGPTGTVTVSFQGHFSRFVDMARK